MLQLLRFQHVARVSMSLDCKLLTSSGGGCHGTSQGANEEKEADLHFEFGKKLNVGLKGANVVCLCRGCRGC